ncbi:hypothetical protein TREMEDRAFT_14387, partial [Tremella mesenterica DSM 1558]|uniref:uncharacterized protein n=1 Tax=Tremella mesenterica (strain ATCC 24925 / CBS 8224 / DSM 1558 / NBRC 9311 / NRRL Y-6157 / RJB 2259-6 / UBC 559-6) TaxID=578456 RepID=UPI0003F49A45
WRASIWYITFVVALGVATDCFCYAALVPVVPFRLQALGYSNVSGLASWLMVSYAGGQVLATFPVAYYFHRHPHRRLPLVGGVITIIGALLLFMFANPYWAMVVARFIQGCAGTVIWSGEWISLRVETCDEKNMGRQIGFAFSGIAIGTIAAPPIGGALYEALGWHAPFVFCIGLCGVDLLMRLLVIEPSRQMSNSNSIQANSAPSSPLSTTSTFKSETASSTEVNLSPWGVMGKIISSPRGMTALALTGLFGLLVGAFDPTLTLRVQSVWGKDSSFVGLIYLIACAPAFVAGPITGAMSDKWGVESVAVPSILLTIPSTLLLLLKTNLPGFIFCFTCIDFFLSCTMSPTGVEVSKIARKTLIADRSDQFGAINVAYASSSALGAIAGGQLYDRPGAGWPAVCWFNFACCIAVLPLAMLWTGDKPLFWR